MARVSNYLRPFVKRGAGVAAALLSRGKVTSKPCDCLMLHDWHGGAQRATILASALADHGMTVRHEVIPAPSRMLLRRELLPGGRNRLDYGLFNRYASFVARKHSPRVLATFMDASPLSVFLRRHVNAVGGALVNIAHGPTASTDLFTMFDCDYYFLFGPSSLEAVQRQKTRIGSTRIVMGGSYLIPSDFELPPSPSSRRIVYLSSWLARPVAETLEANLRLAASWADAQERYHLAIKLHPLEDEARTRAAVAGFRNVNVLPADAPMRAALADAALVMTGWSAASIEAALLNRPCVVVNVGNQPDFFALEEHFGARARTSSEIAHSINAAFAEFPQRLEAARGYVARHLSRTTDGVPFIAGCLRGIAAGEIDFPYTPMPATTVFAAES